LIKSYPTSNSLQVFHLSNFMGHNLVIIVMWNLVFICLYGIYTNVIHLFVLFEHWWGAHCFDTNVICLFILFIHRCCMSICVVYAQMPCTQLFCLNNTQYSYLNNMNPWNNTFHTDLEQTHEACKFVTY
jgi:hypothetical protein